MCTKKSQLDEVRREEKYTHANLRTIFWIRDTPQCVRKKKNTPTEMEILSSGDIPALVSNIEVFSILTKQIDARKEEVSSK